MIPTGVQRIVLLCPRWLLLAIATSQAATIKIMHLQQRIVATGVSYRSDPAISWCSICSPLVVIESVIKRFWSKEIGQKADYWLERKIVIKIMTEDRAR